MRDIKDIAKYIGLSLLSKEMTVSPLKLQKLLYYLQSWYMVAYGRENTLFLDVPEAWVNGPVYPSIYFEYKDAVPTMCDHLKKENFDTQHATVLDAFKAISEKLSFNCDETDLVESVITLYGAQTQNKLIFLTHAERPWVEARGNLKPYEKSSVPISLDTMYAYYLERHQRNRKG